MKTITLTVNDIINCKLIESSTEQQLSSNVKVFFGPERGQRAARVQSKDMELIPSLNDDSLLIKGTMQSLSGKGGPYTSMILFTGIKYVNEGDQHAVSFVGNDDSTYWIMRPKMNNNDVKVSCTCMDFYWRFAMWNAANGTLLGDPPKPYIKKTNRPPVNPDKVDGMCQHLLRLSNRLRSENLLK